MQHYRHADTPRGIPRDLYGIPTLPATSEVPQPAPAEAPQLVRRPQDGTRLGPGMPGTAARPRSRAPRRGLRKPGMRAFLVIASATALVALVWALLVVSQRG